MYTSKKMTKTSIHASKLRNCEFTKKKKEKIKFFVHCRFSNFFHKKQKLESKIFFDNIRICKVHVVNKKFDENVMFV